MKAFALIVLLSIFGGLFGCASGGPDTSTPKANELGNSGVHASGYMETGGTLHAH